MIKAAITTVGLTLFLATAPAGYAQASAAVSPQEDAVTRAVRNEADHILLRQKLVDARAAESRHELVAAAKLYDEAWDLVQSVGFNNVEAEAAQARAGLASARMELARAAQRRNEPDDADTQVKDVLRVDRNNPEARAFKRENDKLIEAQAGRRPSKETLLRGPLISSNKVHAATLVHDGMFLYQMGKYAEAEAKLQQALKLDPENRGAHYYLNLVSEAGFRDALNARDIASRKRLQDVEKDWALPTEGALLPQPHNPYTDSTLIYTGKGRQAIYDKLDRIRLDDVTFVTLPLSEVVIQLSERVRKRDPEKKGINFMISSSIDSTGGASSAAPSAIDPTTGLPTAPTGPTEGEDIATSVLINLTPPLTDIRLMDVLDAIIKVAKPTAIKYSIEEYAVVFSRKLPDPSGSQLFTRRFRIDANTFVQGLQGVSSFVFGQTSTGSGSSGGGIGGQSGGGIGGQNGGQTVSGALIPRVDVAPGGSSSGGFGGQTGGGGGSGGGVNFLTKTNATVQVSEIARAYFTTLGVNLDLPKSIFFNDRLGMLFVRATMQDLDIIEEAIQVLNTAPDEINIKAKFVEVSQDDNRAFGIDWYLGNFLMNKGSIGLQGGTAPSMAAPPSKANPLGWFPGNPIAGTTIPPAQNDQLLTKGLRNSPDALFTLSGILTDPQFRMVLHAIDQRDGSDVLSAPEVTTISGRQAQMKATEIQTIIVDFSFSQSVSSFGGSGGGGFPSDRNVKKDFASVDPQQVLAKVAALPITEWSYRADAPTRHVGPMAQDFRAAFNLGTDDKHIEFVDASGIALAAIKGLNEKNQKLEDQVKLANAQIAARETEIKALKQRLDRLEKLLSRLDK